MKLNNKINSVSFVDKKLLDDFIGRYNFSFINIVVEVTNNYLWNDKLQTKIPSPMSTFHLYYTLVEEPSKLKVSKN